MKIGDASRKFFVNLYVTQKIDFITLKKGITLKVEGIDNEEFLTYIEALVDDYTMAGYGWDEMPDNIKKSLEIALQQSENGETKPHSKVMKNY